MISNNDDSIQRLFDQLEAELPALVHDAWGQGNIDQITDYVPDTANFNYKTAEDDEIITAIELTFDFTYREIADNYNKEVELAVDPFVVEIDDNGNLELNREEMQALMGAKI